MNRLTPFLLPRRGVRGFVAELDEQLEQLFGWREYPPDVARQLGLALAATPLLAADLTQPAQLNLQFQGAGPLKLLVTQIDETLTLRGMAKFAPRASGDFQALMRGGTLAVLLEPRRGAQRYQALVDVFGDTLAEALQIYFGRSEQIATEVRLAASTSRLSGLLVQRLPASEGHAEADWEHVCALMRTVGEADLLRHDGEALLSRVFAEDEVRVFEPRPITLRCRCSHEQTSALLLGLGEEEVAQVLRENEGRVGITCEFCGRAYHYSAADVGALFAAQAQGPDGETRQ